MSLFASSSQTRAPAPERSKTLKSVNPATGDVIFEVEAHTPEKARRRLADAAGAAHIWRDASLDVRGRCVTALGAGLRDKKDELAHVMALEMGKPIREGRAEIEKCAATCDYFAAHAAAFLAPQMVTTEMTKSVVAFRPLGVVFAIMPWNFPFWQVVRAAVPALMAGNGFAFKHASNVPQCALALEDLFARAGFPDRLTPLVRVDGALASELIADPNVAAVTLTGSTEAGKSAARAAAAVVKKCVLELGGSDAYVVLDDADVALAADVCARARLLNSGQSCICAKRFIVHRAVRDAFERAFVERMRAAVVGDPLDERTDVGPLARIDLRDGLHRAVTASIGAGARLVAGGRVPERRGAWYEPTVLVDVPRGAPARDEEMFGPVAALIAVHDEREAIEVANESRYGLAAAVFTRDVARGERIALAGLDAGSVAVNSNVRSDPRLPFGGIKESGYGRELSAFGIHEFVNVKTISVA